MTNASFIKQIAGQAVRMQQKHQILPSLIIAQACLESNYGKSRLAVEGNNLFGVKGMYRGSFISMATREWNKEKGWHTIHAKFRRYPSWHESIEDHALLFVNGLAREKTNRYAPLIGESDYKKATYAVKAAGYATDPNYPQLLNTIIEQYSLTQYDQTLITVNSRIYTVKAGDTLSSIAGKKDTTVAAIVKENNLRNPDFILPGQTLRLPVASSGHVYHTVTKGDTLSGIAVEHRIGITEIIRLNKLADPDKIYPGQRIRVL